MAATRRIAITLEQCWHDVPGGTAWAALESIRALQRYTSVDLIGVSARHRHPPPAPWNPPIPVASLPLPRLALYESWHRLRRPRVERATGPVDLIHVTGMAMPPKSAPLVVTVNDLAFIHDPGHFTRRGVQFFHRAIELACRDADVVVCPSQATINDCLIYGFDASRLRLVPLGIEVDAATGAEIADVRSRHGLTRPYVLWVGTIEPRKNVPVLIDAFAKLDRPDVDLVLVGPEGWNEDLDAHARSLGDRVHRLGFVPTGELPALYAGADLFCLPSIREGFGLPVLEALAQGTPVVTSIGTSTAEIVGDDGTAGALVDPHDPGAVAEAIGAILDDAVARHE